jgi:hypothetical protein
MEAISTGKLWAVDFDAKKNRLLIENSAIGVTITGTLAITGQSESEYGKHGAWRFGPHPRPRDSRIPIMDGLGFRRAWLKPEINGNTMQFHLMARGSVKFSGSLVFEGRVTLGSDSYACRTKPQAGGEVVQVASGGADSRLNDSIFDVEQDSVVQFGAVVVDIKTADALSKKKATFSIQMISPLRTAFSPVLVFDAIPDYYRTRYAPDYVPVTRKGGPEAPTGWMPWNTYFGDAGEKENLAEAQIGARKLKPYGMKYWYVESWTKDGGTNKAREMSNISLEHHKELFPSGMKDFADRIRRLGFKPGIWSCPFGCGDKEFYEQRKNWFLHDPKGKPLGNWCGYYILDPSNPAVIRHVEKMYRVMTKEWGYVFHKVDGTSANNTDYSSVFYERPDVRAAFSRKCEDPMRRLLEAVRRGCGDNAFLLWCCGDPSGPDAALGDAARIGADVVARFKSPQWHNYIDQARMTLVHLLHNNILWHNDPDTLLVGDYAPIESARLAATVVGLPGQAMIASDKLAQLSDERMWLLQRCLPVCPTRPLDLYPIHDLKPIWTLKVRRPFAEWDVVSVFNFEDKAMEKEVRFDALGLDPDQEYLVFDFWKQSFIGTRKGGVIVSTEPRSNSLLSIHRNLQRPQFLSTDRHLSQGGTSIKKMEWNAKRKTLSGKTSLVGGETTSIYFHLPKNWTLASANASKAIAKAEVSKKNLVKLLLQSEKSQDADWTLVFKPGGKLKTLKGSVL